MQRPEKGWDPIQTAYAKDYAENVAPKVDAQKIISEVLEFTGSLDQKKVLDLGAGPGYFTAEFVARGADVTWHDISQYHLQLFKKIFPNLSVRIELGYMEESEGEYDVVFNRVCWYYCLNDKQFAKKIVGLLKKDGKAYLIIPNEGHQEKAKKHLQGLNRMVRTCQYHLNNQLGFKIGHPFLSTNRIIKIFSKESIEFISFDKLRSEEHTSELQSRLHLLFPLLL